MNDRELLELAAKAADVELIPMQINNVAEQGDDRFIGYMTTTDGWPRGWFSPLTDDGDALRLAVKLKIDLRNFHSDEVAAQFKLPDQPGWSEHSEDRSTDPYAATRRAIVRAAAQLTSASNEIGKEMK